MNAVRVERALRAHYPCLLGLVPGLGHVVTGKPLRGLVYLGLVAGFGVLSALTFTSVTGQLLFGIMLSAHVTSIFELLQARLPAGSIARDATFAAAILVVLFVAYWPLMGYLSDTFLEPLARRPHHVYIRPQFPGPIACLFYLTIFVLAFVGMAQHARMPRGDERR